MLPILKPTEKCWQPQDFLPNPEAPEFLDAVRGRLPTGRLGGQGTCLLWVGLAGAGRNEALPATHPILATHCAGSLAAASHPGGA